MDAVTEILKNNRALWVSATVTGGFAILVSLVNIVLWFFQQRKQHKNALDINNHKHEYDKKLEDCKNELNKEIAVHKSVLDKKNYVSKVRFDTEFSVYRELSLLFSEAIEGVHGIIPSGEAYYPTDEDKKQDYVNQLFVKFTKSFAKAQRALYANAPFVSKSIYDKFDEILILIRIQSEVFTEASFLTTFSLAEGQITDEDAQRTDEIDDKFYLLIDDIRDYLASLEIIGGTHQ